MGVILSDTPCSGGMKGCHGIGASEMQHAISSLHGKCRPSPPSSASLGIELLGLVTDSEYTT